MTRFKSFVVMATVGVFLSAISGGALADPGNGNGNGGNSANAPGQQKAATAPAPKPKAQNKGAASQQGNSSPTTAGMKPANNTAKGTHCSTGGTSGAATCTATGSNTQAAAAKQDASKRYGNGTTAAQIAVSRGAPAGTDLYGPGNSQPHKVTDCKHKHGVDVHAVKTYSNAACAQSNPAPSVNQEQKVESACPATTVTTTTTVTSVRTQKGHAYGRLKHGKALHSKTKTSTSTTSTSTPSGASCASLKAALAGSSPTTGLPAQAGTVAQGAVGNLAGQAAAESGKAAVLGVQVSKSSGRTASAEAKKPNRVGGVLGATGRAGKALGAVATSGKLPFTGFPIWATLLIGLGLVGTGVALRRRGVGQTIV
jgi:hypothetical protein